jgi:hypothetical protein
VIVFTKLIKRRDVIIVLRSGIAKGVPSTATIIVPLCVAHLSSGFSWFIQHTSGSYHQRPVIPKQEHTSLEMAVNFADEVFHSVGILNTQ